MKKKDTWIEVEKESEVDKQGQWIEKRKKYIKQTGFNPKIKDSIDLLFRLLTGFAIFIPLLLLFLQNKRDSERAQREKLSQLYTEIITDFQILMTAPYHSERYNEAKDRLITNYSPRLALHGDNRALRNFEIPTYLLIIKGNVEFMNGDIADILSMGYDIRPLAEKLKIAFRDSISTITFKKYSREILPQYDSVVFNFNTLNSPASETIRLIETLESIDSLRTPFYDKVHENLPELLSSLRFLNIDVQLLHKGEFILDPNTERELAPFINSYPFESIGKQYFYFGGDDFGKKVDSIFLESKNQFELWMISQIRK